MSDDREDAIDALAHLAEELADEVRLERIKQQDKQSQPKGAKRKW